MRRMLLVLSVVFMFQALTFAAICPQGDLTGDCVVSFPDLVEFSGQWLNLSECEGDLPCANFDGLNGIDYVDFAVLAGNWLKGMPLVINEFMASNSSASGIKDAQGHYDDWIEIYNFGTESIDLAGMYLTDDLTSPTKWQIPAGFASQTTIVAGGFLVFWADEETQDGPLHTTYKLSAGGEDVGLFGSDGVTMIDGISFPAQSTNIAYGRDPNVRDDWRYFPTPTLEAVNNIAYKGMVEDVQFSHERGFYDALFELTIACESSGASIYYTTDGTDPVVGETAGPTAVLYTEALLITDSTCVRAAAIKTGWMPSAIRTHSYIFGATDVIKSTPVMSLVGDPGQTFYEPDGVMAIVGGYYDSNGNWRSSAPGDYNNALLRGRESEKPVSMEILDSSTGDTTQIECGIRVRGNVRTRYKRGDDWLSGAGDRRFSFNVYFRSDYGASKFDYPLFPYSSVENYDSFAIRGGAQDQANRFLADEWTRRVHINMGAADVAGSFVHFYINGVFKCYMNPCGRQDEEFYQAWYNSDYDWDIIEPADIRDGDNIAWNEMINYAKNNNLSDSVHYQYICDRLDIAAFVDYVILQVYSGNWDWPDRNWVAARERSPEGKFRFGVWDAENIARNWGGVMEGDYSVDIFNNNFPSWWGPNTGLNLMSGPVPELYRALKASPDFRQLWADRMHKHFRNNGAMTKGNLTAAFNQCAAEMGQIPSYWGWYDTGIRDGFIPVREDKFFANCQREGLINNSLGYPIFNVNGSYQHGGYISSSDTITITQSSGSGTVYYTIDGSDPRMPLCPEASDSSNIIFVADNAAKKVRVPASDIGTTWRGGSEPYNETGWTSGSGGVGYETQSGYEPYIGLDVETAMYNIRSTCYLRIPFNIDAGDIGIITSLTLRMRYDDGFVAYINGTEVQRANFSGTPAWNSTTSSSSSEATSAWNSYDISSYINVLHAGTNILAIHGINRANNNSDFLISSELEAGLNVAVDPNLSPGALEYFGGFNLNKSDNLKARIYYSGTGKWSVLDDAVYEVGSVKDKLRITEMMYHPADPNTEYVELKNISSGPINLNLVKFSKGINYTFGDVTLAAGQHILVVENLAAFRAKYGTGLNVAGQYTGSLDNSGEHIRLDDALGNAILDFEYKDGWRSIVDGGGYSLTIINPANADTLSWGYKDSWRASAYVGGSPGADDSGLIPNPGAIVINEVLAHSHSAASDWIELYNTTSNPINVGGWYLSDSATNLKKYRFASGVTIAANGYLVVTEMNNFGLLATDTGKLEAFALSENGDEVYLTSKLDVNNHLTGYRTKEDFGASETGVSFGRYYKSSTGTYNFVLMASNTLGSDSLGAANSYPKVGPIVISEIMYNPDWPAGGSYVNNDYEYVELSNPTGLPVTLFDSAVGLPWKFTSGIDYTFPTTPVTIPAGGKILVVKNPTAFSWRYPGVSLSIIYGPYSGKLANEGEPLELSKPGDVDELGVRHYIRVEQINYSDGSHPGSNPVEPDLWPTAADGNDKSLGRINSASYGNDPNNWQAITPAPGV